MVVGFGRPNLRKNDSVWNGYYEHPITRFGHWYSQELTILFNAEIRSYWGSAENLPTCRQISAFTSGPLFSAVKKSLFFYLKQMSLHRQFD